MPGARDALCHQALQLLAELCARGALEHDSCQDFIYHLRDRARPRLRDPGECGRRCRARPEGPGLGVGAAPGPEAEERCGLAGGGDHRAGRGDQGRARCGLMLAPGGDPAEAPARRPSPAGLEQRWRDHARHLRSQRRGSWGRLRAPRSTSWAPAAGGARGRRKLWEVGSWGRPGAAVKSHWRASTCSGAPICLLWSGVRGRGGIWRWARDREHRILSSPGLNPLPAGSLVWRRPGPGRPAGSPAATGHPGISGFSGHCLCTRS